MAFFDWNMDGEKDWQDSFLEYNIFKECMKEENKDENIFDSDDDLSEDEDEE